MKRTLNVGIDIGSTTVKIVAMNYLEEIVYSSYQRHFSDTKNTILKLLKEFYKKFDNLNVNVTITGSGGISLAKHLNINFVQEVIANSKSIQTFYPKTDVVIELGGEDAKIIYLTNGVDQRMNGSCAGGTGSFIDQIATLLKTDAEGLNELSKNYQNIYPIAARCGVFAKTDVQPLLNEGAMKEDIAISVLQAVVNQTIGGLACGRPIKGNVAFLGGPLFFISELRKLFIKTLKLSDEQVIFPDNAQMYVAIGAALLSNSKNPILLSDLISKIENIKNQDTLESKRLTPLFKSEDEYNEFKDRHNKNRIKKVELSSYEGNSFLGIDAGSTTTKLSLISEEGALLYSYYKSNEGNPLDSCIIALKKLYSLLPSKVKIVNSAVTGYGEILLKNALNIDLGEIETIAHYKAAQFFSPKVEFILDIGGQDMKYIKVKDNTVENIILNEACSSGCGSFLETFANSLNIDIETFSKNAVLSKNPVDLGSRCTVFMNSKVKQSQKEGATIGDISAGLSYSVIKNALFKVIKIKSSSEISDNIVVQGGTFYNDAVLRSFELNKKKKVIRPDISGLMGAFGVALIAKEKYSLNHVTKLLNLDELNTFSIKTTMSKCNFCSNKCSLTINDFGNNKKLISGNRCEKGVGNEIKETQYPNMYQYKYDRLFSYKPLSKLEAIRGSIGIPRVLNIYENFPLWFTFFNELKFKVVLSSKSSKSIYEKGLETIPSESVCYPGKMVHGHIINLIEKGVERIFYPCIPYENKEIKKADNSFNCPIVTSYPEVIKANVDKIVDENIELMIPFLPINNFDRLQKRLHEEFEKFDITKSEISKANKKAWEEQIKYKNDIKIEAEKILKQIRNNEFKGIVLAGRPYHIDPEIHHGIPNLINNLGMAVLTEDSISHLNVIEKPLRVVDQWAYHSRLYSAASFVTMEKNLELIQLNSFGCGLDSVTIDQVQEILNEKSRNYTSIKIDEGSNLGAIKIRLRSLLAVINENKEIKKSSNNDIKIEDKTIFTKNMRSKHTILVPAMSPIHFQFLKTAFKQSGYNVVLLLSKDQGAVDEGLRYVNNDACYPAILVIGEIISALKSRKYDLNNTSVMISQTGGGCRATNYIAYLKKALIDSGFKNIPILSANLNNLEDNPGFKLSLPLVNRILMSIIYGDLLMKVLYRVRPYEKIEGSANELYKKWVKICKTSLIKADRKTFSLNIKNIVKEFDNLDIFEIKKARVGIVGEILIKFHPVGNNDLVKLLEDEGVEVVVPDLLDFIFYCASDPSFKYKHLDGSILSKVLGDSLIIFMEFYRKVYIDSLKDSKRFDTPKSIYEIAQGASQFLSLGHQTGEGWFLTGEIIELIESGVPNVICVQPFGCLPNHITGKGMIKKIKNTYPDTNLVAIDYDPGASEVNQINRIKLMLSN